MCSEILNLNCLVCDVWRQQAVNFEDAHKLWLLKRHSVIIVRIDFHFGRNDSRAIFSSFLNRQPVPMLCDDLLLDIFSNLNIRQMCVVSLCNRRLQSTFNTAKALDGRIDITSFDDEPSHDVKDHSHARYRNVCAFLGTFAMHNRSQFGAIVWPMPWHSLNINNLMWMEVRFSQFRKIVPSKDALSGTETFGAIERVSSHDVIQWSDQFMAPFGYAPTKKYVNSFGR